MVGDADDMAGRMKAVLPVGWFGDATPNLDAILAGMGTAWSLIYGLIEFCVEQSRIATATDSFLDLIAGDFFGTGLLRRNEESDSAFRLRIEQELLRPRATRAALALMLSEMGGRAPVIFEPARPGDTGAYGAGGLGYGVAGGWGNLNLPFQFLVTAYRPSGAGTAEIAGYGSGGVPAYGSPDMEQAGVSDGDIMRAIAGVIPAGVVAWTRISD